MTEGYWISRAFFSSSDVEIFLSKSLFTLLTRHFLQLVCIAFIIAMPIGWYLMLKWLEDYTYGIDISWDIFLIAGGVTLLIAMLTVSFESLKAAVYPPIDNLRSE